MSPSVKYPAYFLIARLFGAAVSGDEALIRCSDRFEYTSQSTARCSVFRCKSIEIFNIASTLAYRLEMADHSVILKTPCPRELFLQIVIVTTVC